MMNGLEIKEVWLNELQERPMEADPPEPSHLADALAYMLMGPPQQSVKTQLLSATALDPRLQAGLARKITNSQTQTTSMAEPITSSEILTSLEQMEQHINKMEAQALMVQEAMLRPVIQRLTSMAINLDLEVIDPTR